MPYGYNRRASVCRIRKEIKIILLGKIYKFVEKTEEIVIIILLSAMVINVTLGVFCRYVLNSSLSWTEELARYFMVWFAYIGMALAFKDESHVNVSFIVSKFPLYLRHIIKLVVYVLVLCLLVVLFVQSISLLKIVRIQTSPSVQIPMIYPYLSVTIGALLMMIEVIKLMYFYLKDIKK